MLAAEHDISDVSDDGDDDDAAAAAHALAVRTAAVAAQRGGGRSLPRFVPRFDVAYPTSWRDIVRCRRDDALAQSAQVTVPTGSGMHVYMDFSAHDRHVGRLVDLAPTSTVDDVRAVLEDQLTLGHTFVLRTNKGVIGEDGGDGAFMDVVNVDDVLVVECGYEHEVL